MPVRQPSLPPAPGHQPPGQPVGFTWTALAIYALRKVRGISQAQLAKAIGAQQVQISHWETGRFKPNPRNQRVLDQFARPRDYVLMAEISWRDRMVQERKPRTKGAMDMIRPREKTVAAIDRMGDELVEWAAKRGLIKE